MAWDHIPDKFCGIYPQMLVFPWLYSLIIASCLLQRSEAHHGYSHDSLSHLSDLPHTSPPLNQYYFTDYLVFYRLPASAPSPAYASRDTKEHRGSPAKIPEFLLPNMFLFQVTVTRQILNQVQAAFEVPNLLHFIALFLSTDSLGSTIVKSACWDPCGWLQAIGHKSLLLWTCSRLSTGTSRKHIYTIWGISCHGVKNWIYTKHELPKQVPGLSGKGHWSLFLKYFSFWLRKDRVYQNWP